MKREDIKIGKKVKYYPYLGIKSIVKITEIRSMPWDCCGMVICKVNDIVGGVNIENLEEI